MNVCYNTPAIINGYKVMQVGDQFTIYLPEKTNVFFKVDYTTKGLYTKCIGYWDINKDRAYQAKRYLFKYVGLVQSIGFGLLTQDYLWDYDKQQPALKTYKAQMKNYYDKCIAKGLSIEPWLVDLMNNNKY